MPLRFIVPADLKTCAMKCEFWKMKVMIDAVIAGAQELEEWDGQNSAWDAPWVIQLYESVQHLFEYPSLTSTHRSTQISWRTVYNLYINSFTTIWVRAGTKNSDPVAFSHRNHYD
jgi:hypothetical protein